MVVLAIWLPISFPVSIQVVYRRRYCLRLADDKNNIFFCSNNNMDCTCRLDDQESIFHNFLTSDMICSIQYIMYRSADLGTQGLSEGWGGGTDIHVRPPYSYISDR